MSLFRRQTSTAIRRRPQALPSRGLQSLRLSLLLVAATLTLVLGCGEPDSRSRSSNTRILLLDLVSGCEVSWPENLPSPPSSCLPAADMGSAPPPGLIGRVTLKEGELFRDTRAALLAPASSSYRFSLTLPHDPELHVAFGIIEDSRESHSRVSFRITLSTVQHTGITLLEEIHSTADSSTWLDRTLDLSPWVDTEVTLVFEVKQLDENEMLWAAWACPEVRSRSWNDSGWDVVLISLDTLRADRLGLYGHDRQTSPSIDRLARRHGFTFATAVCQSPWTRPSHTSLLRSIYPLSNEGVGSPPLPTLLRHAGYRTCGVTGGGQLDADFGFAEGFHLYQTSTDQCWPVEMALGLSHLESPLRCRTFLFLHTYEIHDPYRHSHHEAGLQPGRIHIPFSKAQWLGLKKRLTSQERAYVSALYDSGINMVDLHLGRFIARLKRLGRLDRTVLIITSDHGEQFWEHGSWRHGQAMYEEQIRVPLIICLPPDLEHRLDVASEGTSGTRIKYQQARLIDIYPTLLDLLHIPLDHQVHGRSLCTSAEGCGPGGMQAFIEDTNISIERKALRTTDYKYILSYPEKYPALPPPGSDLLSFELYDLRTDPLEINNLAGQYPDLTTRLDAEIRSIVSPGAGKGLESSTDDHVRPELTEQLKKLGYLD